MRKIRLSLELSLAILWCVGLTVSAVGQDASGRMSAEVRKQVVEAAARELAAKYAYPAAGKAMGAKLTGFYDRLENKLVKRWTRPVSGPKYLAEPIYVLTSSKTPSAAESLAYTLQAAKRAIVVGESTWGGANPSIPVKLTDHFGMIMPFGRAVNPITGTNWEGTGVIPDVKAPLWGNQRRRLLPCWPASYLFFLRLSILMVLSRLG